MFAFAVSLITVLDFFETRESLSVEECSSFSNTRPLKPKYLLFSGGPGSWLRLPLQRYGRRRRLSSLQPNASRSLPEPMWWLQQPWSCDGGAGKDQQRRFYVSPFHEEGSFPQVSCWKGSCPLLRWTLDPFLIGFDCFNRYRELYMRDMWSLLVRV